MYFYEMDLNDDDQPRRGSSARTGHTGPDDVFVIRQIVQQMKSITMMIDNDQG